MPSNKPQTDYQTLFSFGQKTRFSIVVGDGDKRVEPEDVVAQGDIDVNQSPTVIFSNLCAIIEAGIDAERIPAEHREELVDKARNAYYRCLYFKG